MSLKKYIRIAATAAIVAPLAGGSFCYGDERVCGCGKVSGRIVETLDDSRPGVWLVFYNESDLPHNIKWRLEDSSGMRRTFGYLRILNRPLPDSDRVAPGASEKDFVRAEGGSYDDPGALFIDCAD
jgi:hypothetical protein